MTNGNIVGNSCHQGQAVLSDLEGHPYLAFCVSRAAWPRGVLPERRVKRPIVVDREIVHASCDGLV